MINNLISIIIPVYNAGNFLVRCIKSLLCQSYSDFEIIIINDGSTDNSETVINSFKDPRIRIFSQCNKGVSFARNKGLNVSKGEYIVFVDADDYVEPTYLEQLLFLMSDKTTSMGGSAYIIEDDTTIQEVKIKELQSNYNYIDFLYRIVANNDCGGYLWNKIFRNDIIRQNHISFDQDVKICEDMLFCCQYLDAAKGVVGYSENPIYHYVQHENSSLRKNKNYLLFEEFKAVKQIYNIAEKYPGTAFNETISARYVNDLFRILYNQTKDSGVDYIKGEKGEIQSLRHFMLKNNKIKKLLYEILPFPLFLKVIRKK